MQALEPLLYCLKAAIAAHRNNPYDHYFEGVVDGVSGIKNIRAAAALIEFLKDGNGVERQIIRGGLVKMGSIVIEQLIPILKDEDPEMRSEAETILWHIGGSEVQRILDEYRSHKS